MKNYIIFGITGLGFIFLLHAIFGVYTFVGITAGILILLLKELGKN